MATPPGVRAPADTVRWCQGGAVPAAAPAPAGCCPCPCAACPLPLAVTPRVVVPATGIDTALPSTTPLPPGAAAAPAASEGMGTVGMGMEGSGVAGAVPAGGVTTNGLMDESGLSMESSSLPMRTSTQAGYTMARDRPLVTCGQGRAQPSKHRRPGPCEAGCVARWCGFAGPRGGGGGHSAAHTAVLGNHDT